MRIRELLERRSADLYHTTSVSNAESILKKDGGMVYWNSPLPSNKTYKNNLHILVSLIKKRSKP